MKLAAMGKGVKCELCGKNHQVHFCKLPGAASYRRMLKAGKTGGVKAHILKKPMRHGSARSKGNHRKTMQLKYSGKAAVALRRKKRAVYKNPVRMRRAPLGDSAHQAACQKLAVAEMNSVGYLQIPTRCPTCKVGWLCMVKQTACHATQVKYQCNDNDCRAVFSALSFSSVLPKAAGRGMTPTKVLDAIRYYTSAGVTTPPSASAAAKQLHCGIKPVVRIFHALQAKEAELGETLNSRVRLTVNVEVDGHRLRTGRIGHRQALRLYPDLVREWKSRHKKEPFPKYWLMPLVILGAWERGSDKSVLASGRLKLSAPSSKPGTEGLEEVRCANMFKRVGNKTVIFPDGAVAWETVAHEQNATLRVAPVIHAKQQFVKADRHAKTRGASRLRGTQVIDRRWDSLDDWVGKNIATLVKGKPNPAIMRKARSYQWRVRQQDVFKQLGNACRRSQRARKA